MSKLDKDQVLEQFTAAYTKANGKAPTIEAKGGWYSIDGGKNVRLAQVEELTDELSAQKVATKSPAKAKKEPTAEPKVETKAEPAKKAAAPKKATKKAKSKGSFSVKAMWAEKIQANNPGSQPPR